MTVVRIRGLVYASLVVIRIPGCYTHPLLYARPLYASLVVIRLPGC